MFGSPSATIDTKEKLLIDAKRPDTHYLTLHSYREWAKRLAMGLTRAGLKEGDRVMLFSGNSIFNPVVAMGTLMAGGIYNSANPAYTPRELAHQLKDAGPSLVLAAENCIERAMGAARLVGLDEKRIFLFTDVSPNHEAHIPPPPVPYQHWSTLLVEHSAAQAFIWGELNSPDLASRTAILLYSSGTTGLPKALSCLTAV